MSAIDQASFEAGLRTAVDLANASATRLEASQKGTDLRRVAAVNGLRSFADGVQALLEAREPDPIAYTVRAITEGY